MAVVGVVTLTAWAAAAGDPAPAPAATLTAPATGAPPAPAAAVPPRGSDPGQGGLGALPGTQLGSDECGTPDSSQPWICVRAWGIDGQVLDLTLDGTWVTMVRIMPGVNAEADGQDQWLKYRTLGRGKGRSTTRPAPKSPNPPTAAELLTQTVAPANCASSPCRVVASQVTLTVEKTTAPASAPTGTGLEPSAPPPQGTPQAFGVSRIEIIGYRAG